MLKRMNSRPATAPGKLVLIGVAGIVGALSCAEPEPWWRQPHARRPPPMPRAQTEPKTTQPSGGENVEQKPAAAVTPQPAEVFEEPGFSQLVLLSGSAVGGAPAGLNDSVLAHAPAERVGELVGTLHPVAGATGTSHRFTLIYPSSIEGDAAREAVHELDVPVLEGTNAQVPQGIEQAFAFGVGVLYGTAGGSSEGGKQLALAEASLVRALTAADEPGKRRWAAGMIAGWIRGDRMNDHRGAQAHFEAARQVVESNSLEHMTAMYAWSRSAVRSGRPQAAEGTLESVIGAYGKYENTEVFRRARETLAELEGKRSR